MMLTLSELVTYLDQLLNPKPITDYCPNGLQVAGKKNIRKIITGVTANQDLLDAAVAEQADAILVHHGFFWKHENPCIQGIKYQRLRTLIQHEISLLSYHLPLDLHPVYGNNAQLGLLLNLSINQRFTLGGISDIGFLGELPQEMTGEAMVDYLTQKLNRKPLHITPANNKKIKTIAWCTGAAQSFILEVADQNVDAYLTGEVSLSTVDIARETGLHFFAAGHHATERYGVMALGKHLAEKFGIQHQFIDIDNPI